MGIYLYDMAADPRYELTEFYKPDREIPVIYAGEVISHSNFLSSGDTLMDIPDHLVSKLRNGKAKIFAWNERISDREANDTAQPRKVIKFEISDV
jgi:hypothetical protein